MLVNVWARTDAVSKILPVKGRNVAGKHTDLEVRRLQRRACGLTGRLGRRIGWVEC
jgi:hypothetical protein